MDLSSSASRLPLIPKAWFNPEWQPQAHKPQTKLLGPRTEHSVSSDPPLPDAYYQGRPGSPVCYRIEGFCL